MGVYNSDSAASWQAIENAADAFIAYIEGQPCGQNDVELDGIPLGNQIRFLRTTIHEATQKDVLVLKTNDAKDGTWHLLLVNYSPVI